MTTYLQLGRNGDILNAAQICYHEHLRTGEKVRLIVGQEFAPILDGFSYIERIVFPGTQDELTRAMQQFCRRGSCSGPNCRQPAIVLQSWMNPDQSHQTDSYQKEAWRRAGKLDAFGTVPLVVDQRDQEREAQFCSQFPFPTKKAHALYDGMPWILVADKSPSSPFHLGAQLILALEEAFGKTHCIIPISQYHAPRPYDLLGLFDRAQLLVTVDTMPLHLARASRIPVIAIVNDVGTRATPGPWTASVPPPQAVETLKYSEFNHTGAIPIVVSMARNILESKTPRIIHAVQLHGAEDRHIRAQSSWSGLFDVSVRASDWPRNSTQIGDSRELPYLKDVLRVARAGKSDDIVFWCNDDNALSPDLPDFLRKHVPVCGACAFRRSEAGITGIHMGAEAFGFTVQWLRQNWNQIPDYLLGAAAWDIGLRALIRLQRGIVTTKQNLTTDFWPMDIGTGYVFHEAHPSAWSGANDNSPSNQHNRRLLAEWQAKNIPQMKEQLA